jgi:ATP-dependent protease ClpP protease subunit
MEKKRVFILAWLLLINISNIYSKEILLNKSNSLLLRGQVNSYSISKLIQETMDKCNKLKMTDDRSVTDQMTDQVYDIKGLVTDDSTFPNCSAFSPSQKGKPKVCDEKSSVMLSFRHKMREVGNFISKLFMTAKKPDLYLVIDSPGGSVLDGVDYIRIMPTVGCNIHTVSIEAISMGFQIAQQGVVRYMASKGTQMSHRAATSGISGQLDGELESQIAWIKSIILDLDKYVSKRIGIPLSEYKQKIVNEWWLYDTEAIDQNTADEMADIVCSPELIKETYIEEFVSIMGIKEVVWSACPLLRSPIKINRK